MDIGIEYNSTYLSMLKSENKNPDEMYPCIAAAADKVQNVALCHAGRKDQRLITKKRQISPKVLHRG